MILWSEQNPPIQDTVLVDSLQGFVPESPLPGGMSDVVRFLFQVPQWIQIVGFLASAVIGVWAAVRLWRSRREVLEWLASRTPNFKRGLWIGGGLAAVVAALVGARSWDYMQHDNDFCTSCHVMATPFERFNESEHNDLNCHDCHRQSILASSRQMYLWVTERPVEIAEHSPVPDQICEECHVTGEEEVWQRVKETAGHRTHFESDSVDLDEIQCVTCHGAEVHRFVPVNQTCSQAGCHVDREFQLADMADQTSLHCAACHEFAAEVPLLATADSARGTLRPALQECTACHEMREALIDFDEGVDPHGGTCGMCHNPHEQSEAREAAQTCASAGCHDQWESRPFHVGPSHLNVGEQCTLCHEPHRSVVDPSDCVGCHRSVIEHPDAPADVRRRLERALPFDTTRAIGSRPANPPPARSDPPSADRFEWGVLRHWGAGFGVPEQPPPAAAALLDLFAQQPDSFEHDTHTDLSCLTCHVSDPEHGQLSFEAPRGCQICHHQRPAESDCTSCHTADEIAPTQAVHVRVTTAGHPTRERDVGFQHAAHESLTCLECHAGSVDLPSTADAASCSDCHGDHHVAERECASCHVGTDYYQAHDHSANAHVACDACHDTGTIATLTPDRTFCATCHLDEQGDHYPQKECTQCHLQATPEEYRARLTKSGTGS